MRQSLDKIGVEGDVRTGSSGQTGIGLNAGNFKRIGHNGLGDPMNSYAHAMGWFNDYLYVGTTRGILYAPKPFERESRMKIWPVKVPEVIWDADYRAEILRYNPRTCEWRRVFKSPVCTGKAGFRVPRNIGFRCMASVNGDGSSAPALYVTSWSTHQGPGVTILRTFNGVDFEEVFSPESCDIEIQTFRSLVSFKGRLFASTTGRAGEGDTSHGRLLVLTSDIENPRDWRPACEPYFGDPNNHAVWTMAAYNGFLYAGTMNPREGFQIWRTDAEGKPPYKWTRVLSHGAHRGRLNEICMSMCEFGGSLYIGTAIQYGGHDRIHNVGPGAAELIRLNPDDSWDLIVGEPRFTPDGFKTPLSGMGPGFDYPFTAYMWCMCAHDGHLYVGTSDITVFMRFASLQAFPKWAQKIFEDVTFRKFLKDRSGFDLWRTSDGVRWIPITRNGFGHPYNLGVRTMASTPFGLFLGTANPFGPELAVERAVGWVYEPHKDGGLEVWWGTPSQAADSSSVPSGVIGNGSGKEAENDVPAIRIAKDSAGIEKDLIDDFYRGSGFCHVGFWGEGLDALCDAKAACENLMEEILAFLRPAADFRSPQPCSEEEARRCAERIYAQDDGSSGSENDFRLEGTVLDLGCGLGATTGYLLKHFAPGGVTGVTDDGDNLEVCRRNAPGTRFFSSKLPKLSLADDSFDYVVCVESPCRYGQEKLLREALRVLKPGGRLVGSDVLFAGRTRRRGLPWTSRPTADDPEEYRKMLAELGFQDVRIVDVTNECWEGFNKHGTLYAEIKAVLGEVDVDSFRRIRAAVLDTEAEVSHYILFSAKKP